MNKRQLLVLSLLAGLLLVPIVASADSHEMGPKPLTWISYVQSQPGKSNALSQHLAESGAKTYDPLMADGRIISWGVSMPVNHRAGDDWNIMEWVTFRDWAAVDAFMQGFMTIQMAKSPEEMKAEQEKWYSLIEAGSHYDAIVQHEVVKRGDGSRPGYFGLGFYAAKPGQDSMVTKLFETYGVPVMSALQEKGKVGAFGLAVEEVHQGSDWSHVFWYEMPNLAARGAVTAALTAAGEERGEEAQAKMLAEMGAAFDMSAHHDRIMMVTHFGGGGAGDGGGGGE